MLTIADFPADVSVIAAERSFLLSLALTVMTTLPEPVPEVLLRVIQSAGQDRVQLPSQEISRNWLPDWASTVAFLMERRTSAPLSEEELPPLLLQANDTVEIISRAMILVICFMSVVFQYYPFYKNKIFFQKIVRFALPTETSQKKV